MNMAKLIDIVEKGHYPFKRYPKKNCETVLFPGCAFPSQFPQTMDKLAAICSENGVGIAYDCCGVPLMYHGKLGMVARILGGIKSRLTKCGCKRVVFICPNCAEYLKDKLGFQTITVYELLSELGVQQASSFEEGMLYIPCPDRQEREIERSLREGFDLQCVESCTRGCCGLRPDIAAKGPEVSQKCGKSVIKAAGERRIYTYCASCAGQFKRLQQDGVRHAVSVILGVDEEPDAAHAIMNRAKRKFDKNSDPK